MGRIAGQVLRLFLNQQGFVSGEAISRELNVSRTAVWKQINVLRKEGYVIEALPSQGYRLLLNPDVLRPEEISAGVDGAGIGSKIICLQETASTNMEAFRLAGEGSAHGTVVLAEMQHNGKGRMGRRWESPTGVNLYCSVILRPEIMPHEAPQLTFLSSVAVARAIQISTGLEPMIKWPNDLLLRDKKVAGLLNEMSAETDRINFVILGIGVNLNMAETQFPADLRQPATSVMLEYGSRLNRSAFAAVMLNELDRLYSDFLAYGFAPVRKEWQQLCNANGREVTVNDSGQELVSGSFAGIDGDGALLVRRTDNEVVRILCGDVRVF